jgi:RHS repeat-associated protein
MLGQNKAAKARFDFAPYGELMRSAGLPLTVGYTGHRWDPAIGQYFAPFRYYNPQTARWNMRDPLGMVDGTNVYAYVTGNPVRYSDPYGLSALPSGRFPCRLPTSHPNKRDHLEDNDRDSDFDYPYIPRDVYTGAGDILGGKGAPSGGTPPLGGGTSNGKSSPKRWERPGDGYKEILNDDRNNEKETPHVDYMKIHKKSEKSKNLKVRIYPPDINKGEQGLMCEQDTSVGGE